MRAERALGTSRTAVIGRRVIHAFCLGHGTLIVNQLLGSFGPNVYALREKAGPSGLRQNGESRRTGSRVTKGFHCWRSVRRGGNAAASELKVTLFGSVVLMNCPRDDL